MGDVLSVLRLADGAGARLWIDGGWGVDTLLGGQTREHGDLDVAIEARYLSAFRDALSGHGFMAAGDSSYDFNPSLGVSNVGGLARVWLNWAATDPVNDLPASVLVDSAAPGTGVPNLLGTALLSFVGGVTSQTRFGDYSAVSVESSCTATTTQQYYAAGASRWRTRIGRFSFC